ncbi:CE1759 family FMN reductase [Brevibacterium album]|uniref:CE1759 family FMN reductase n=1 Tax=Brevibacterium album TaxID=417948 RepID=UPI0006860397|nr:CE1759 family FMN reductase [Brevibacterium album]
MTASEAVMREAQQGARSGEPAEGPEIVVVSSGLSEDSATTRLAQRMLDAVLGLLAARGVRARSTHVRLRGLARALTDLTVSGVPAPEVEEAFAAVRRADAVITVAPVYKAAPVGIHTLFWQLIDDASLAGTPVLLGSTGGTPRHSLAAEAAMRPLIAYLKGIAAPTAVFAATDDWGAGAASGLRERIAAAAAELVALMGAVAGGAGAPESGSGASHEAGGLRFRADPGAQARAARLRDEFDPESVIPFAQLLGR